MTTSATRPIARPDIAAGDDVLGGDEGRDTVYGEDGDDLIFGQDTVEVADHLNGGANGTTGDECQPGAADTAVNCER